MEQKTRSGNCRDAEQVDMYCADDGPWSGSLESVAVQYHRLLPRLQD